MYSHSRESHNQESGLTPKHSAPYLPCAVTAPFPLNPNFYDVVVTILALTVHKNAEEIK